MAIISKIPSHTHVAADQTDATTTPAASKIPIADGNAKIDTWVSDSGAAIKGKVQLAGDLAGTAASPTVVGIHSGATGLSISTITDGEIIKRSGTDIISIPQFIIITFTFDNGTSAIAANSIAAVYCPYACTIKEWTIGSVDNTSGSIVFDIWVDSQANFPPTVADTITASAKPTVSSATKAQSSTLTGWTTSIAAGSWIYVNVDSCTSIKKAVLALKVQ